MKFRNPWIEPKVLDVRVAIARGYLEQRGWKVTSDSESNLFHATLDRGTIGPIALTLPMTENQEDYPQAVIDLITVVARLEDRYAGEILYEILAFLNAPNSETVPPTIS